MRNTPKMSSLFSTPRTHQLAQHEPGGVGCWAVGDVGDLKLQIAHILQVVHGLLAHREEPAGKLLGARSRKVPGQLQRRSVDRRQAERGEYDLVVEGAPRRHRYIGRGRAVPQGCKGRAWGLCEKAEEQTIGSIKARRVGENERGREAGRETETETETDKGTNTRTQRRIDTAYNGLALVVDQIAKGNNVGGGVVQFGSGVE